MLLGAGIGAAGVYQYGGSVVQNDGAGGYMEGSASAQGDAGAVAGGLGLAAGEAEAFGTQTHRYEQGVVTGSGFQQASGEVSTSVQATAP